MTFKKMLQTLQEKGAAVQLGYGIGHNGEIMKNATDRIGHVIMAGEDEAELDGYLEMLREAVKIV